MQIMLYSHSRGLSISTANQTSVNQKKNSYLLKQKYILEVSKEVCRGHKNKSNAPFKFSPQLDEKEHLVLKLKDIAVLIEHFVFKHISARLFELSRFVLFLSC